MHQKRFGQEKQEAHAITHSGRLIDFYVRNKVKYDDHYGMDNQFSIYPNPDGIDVLLTNLPYPKLRAARAEEQTSFHFNWGQAEQLHATLGKMLKEHTD